MISPFDYCMKCGLVYCHIQNFECVVCHGELAPIEGLLVPGRHPTTGAVDSAEIPEVFNLQPKVVAKGRIVFDDPPSN